MAQAQTARTTDATTTQANNIATSTNSAFDPRNSSDVEAKVRSYFADIPVMISIAGCESGFRQYDADGNPLYGGTGSMVGVYQESVVIHGSLASKMGWNINTLDGNLAYARYLYGQEGVVPWLSSSSCWDSSPLKSTLQLGSKGSQVAELQKLLNRNGFAVAKSGPGAPGEESTLFGSMTQKAVQRFQCSMGIVCSGNEHTTGYGVVGSHTRLALLRADSKSAHATSTALSLQ